MALAPSRWYNLAKEGSGQARRGDAAGTSTSRQLCYWCLYRAGETAVVHGPWVPNTLVQLSIIGSCQGQAIVNVHHFEASAGTEATLLSDTLAQTYALNLGNDWLTNEKVTWLALHTSDYSLTRLQVQVLERPGNVNHRLVPQDITTGLPSPGSLVEASDELSTCGVAKWKSVTAGRSHRGRTYIGPIAGSRITGGVLDASIKGNIDTYVSNMINRYTGLGAGAAAGYVFTIYSRPYSNTGVTTPEYQYTRRGPAGLTIVTPPDYAGQSSFVVSGSTDTVARVQRRREIGVGS